MNASGIMPPNKTALLDFMNLHNVRVITKAKIKQIQADGIQLEDQFMNADSIVAAVGYTSTPLMLDNQSYPIHLIGDAQKVGNLMSVIHAASALAYQL